SARLRRARLEGELAAAHQDIEQLHTTMSAHTADIEAGIAAAQVVAECDDLVAHLRLGEELQSHRSLLAQHLQLAKADEQLQREEWLRAREARVAGMAAELATQLAVGGECPVCGSCEHPHRATRTPTHVDDATETAARRRYETAASTLQTLREEHSALTAKLSAHAARHRGDSLSEVIARQHEAQLHVDRAEQARGRLVLANTRLEGLQETARSRQSEVEQIDAEISGLEQTMAETEVSIAELRLRLHTLLSQHDTDDVERLADDLRARRELLHDALSAFAEHNRAAQAAQDQLRALLDAAASHGFDTIDQVREALLDQESTAELSHRVVRHDEDVASCLAVLNQPEIAAALRQAAPDLDVLAAAEQQTATELGDLHVALSHANGQLIRGTDLADTLSRQLRGIAPLREQADLTRELATLVDGKGPNNDLRISLSAYVLAQRLRQVVAAANDRLGRMSDHRYHLQHTEERGARERQGGLGLLVVDDWTGIARAPETLSGGESFIVSLALALGLADVVAYEAGGVEIGTLFVDEGFGSLDPDSLEQVLDVLDELRSGGRVVGVVSHVVGMRERIPTRLDVVKGRNGSTVRRSA
ncbi:MAG TPA: SMC family ATPase, partial [Marmoricola sp.]|nr:SMC family ATPase [Marmoricola sp.]